MMKNNHGKIFKILIICTLFTSLLFADVKLTVDAPAIYEGESASFTITCDGSDCKFPTINMIGDYSIEGTSSSSSTTIINGDYSKKISKTYSFSPTKDVTIPSFDVTIDGKVYKTEPQKISVIKPSASKNGDDFVVEVKADKQEVKVGESINLDVLFKYKLDSRFDKLQLNEPKLENFWIKKVGDVQKSSQNDYIVLKQKYILFPQKSGEFDLSSLEADVGKLVQDKMADDFMNDPFFKNSFFDSVMSKVSWQKIYSNSLHIKVNSLPNNLELFGDFSLKANVDKTQVDANQPVNLTISIEGKGNIDDIQKYNLSINNVISYADDPKTNVTFKENEYQGSFTQKIAFVAQDNYTIPKISLTYFDKNTNQVKTISSEPIDIKVTNSNPNNSNVKIETSNNISMPQVSNTTQVGDAKDSKNTQLLILGFVVLLILIVCAIFFKNKKAKKVISAEKDIVLAIKKAKNDKELFDLLLPFSKKSPFVSDTLNKLEENLYKNANHKIDKNQLMDFFEDEIV